CTRRLRARDRAEARFAPAMVPTRPARAGARQAWNEPGARHAADDQRTSARARTGTRSRTGFAPARTVGRDRRSTRRGGEDSRDRDRARRRRALSQAAPAPRGAPADRLLTLGPSPNLTGLTNSSILFRPWFHALTFR